MLLDEDVSFILKKSFKDRVCNENHHSKLLKWIENIIFKYRAIHHTSVDSNNNKSNYENICIDKMRVINKKNLDNIIYRKFGFL